MADLNAGLGGLFGGASQGLEFMLRLREQEREREEQRKRFEEEMAFRQDQFRYGQERDTAMDQRYGREQIRDERQRREDFLTEQINKRGGSVVGDVSGLSDMIPIRRGEPESVSQAIGQFAPGVAPGVQSALESARGARAEGAVDLARKLATARQQAQSTQRTQQVPGAPIVVDPNEIFNPAGIRSIQSNERIDDFRRRDAAVQQAIGFLRAEPAIALLKGDLFALPEDKRREAQDALQRAYQNMVGFARYYGVDPNEIVRLSFSTEGIDPGVIGQLGGGGARPAGPQFSNPFGGSAGGGAPPSPPAAAPSAAPSFGNPFTPQNFDSSVTRRSRTSGPSFTNPFGGR